MRQTKFGPSGRPAFVWMATLMPALNCFAENPIVQTIFTADPAPMVHDGTVFTAEGHQSGRGSDHLADARCLGAQQI